MKPKLPDQLAATVLLLSPKTWRSTSEVHRNGWDHEYVGRTAIANRLQRLRALGHVVCQRRGKDKFWRKA